MNKNLLLIIAIILTIYIGWFLFKAKCDKDIFILLTICEIICIFGIALLIIYH